MALSRNYLAVSDRIASLYWGLLAHLRNGVDDHGIVGLLHPQLSSVDRVTIAGPCGILWSRRLCCGVDPDSPDPLNSGDHFSKRLFRGSLSRHHRFSSMRHVEIYFSLLTLAFAQFVYTVVFKWAKVTGGDDGLMNIPQLTLSFFGLTKPLFTPDSPVKYYYLVLFFIILSALALHTITRSAFGRVLKGIHQNTERVAFLGLNPKNFRLAAFVIAGALSGLAGALFAPFQGNISPMAVHWTKSVDPLFMNIIGGMESLVGPAVGSVVFMFFREWLSSITEYWRIWFGSLLVIISLLLPHGLMGFFSSRLIRFLSGRGEAPKQTQTQDQ